MEKQVYAEDVVNYWKTSKKSSPDDWMNKTKLEIERAGGKILGDGFVSDNGKAAFVLKFILDNQTFKLLYPVLRSRKGDGYAAKIQAATFMFHSIKAKCIDAKLEVQKSHFLSHCYYPVVISLVRLRHLSWRWVCQIY